MGLKRPIAPLAPRSAPPGWQRDPVTGVLTPDRDPAEPQAVALPLDLAPERPALAMVLAPLVGLLVWGLLLSWLI